MKGRRMWWWMRWPMPTSTPFRRLPRHGADDGRIGGGDAAAGTLSAGRNAAGRCARSDAARPAGGRGDSLGKLLGDDE